MPVTTWLLAVDTDESDNYATQCISTPDALPATTIPISGLGNQLRKCIEARQTHEKKKCKKKLITRVMYLTYRQTSAGWARSWLVERSTESVGRTQWPSLQRQCATRRHKTSLRRRSVAATKRFNAICEKVVTSVYLYANYANYANYVFHLSAANSYLSAIGWMARPVA